LLCRSGTISRWGLHIVQAPATAIYTIALPHSKCLTSSFKTASKWFPNVWKPLWSTSKQFSFSRSSYNCFGVWELLLLKKQKRLQTFLKCYNFEEIHSSFEMVSNCFWSASKPFQIRFDTISKNFSVPMWQGLNWNNSLSPNGRWQIIYFSSASLGDQWVQKS